MPKLQQFKNYNFYKIIQEDKEQYNRYFLPSDHLTIRYSSKDIIENQRYPFLEMKARYNPQSWTKNDWELGNSQLTMINNSSVCYYIINNDKNDLFLRPSTSNKRINLKKFEFGIMLKLATRFILILIKNIIKIFLIIIIFLRLIKEFLLKCMMIQVGTEIYISFWYKEK